MIDDRAPFDWTKPLAEDDDDRRFRRKAWVAALCGLAALWIAVGAVVVAAL